MIVVQESSADRTLGKFDRINIHESSRKIWHLYCQQLLHTQLLGNGDQQFMDSLQKKLLGHTMLFRERIHIKFQLETDKTCYWVKQSLPRHRTFPKDVYDFPSRCGCWTPPAESYHWPNVLFPGSPIFPEHHSTSLIENYQENSILMFPLGLFAWTTPILSPLVDCMPRFVIEFHLHHLLRLNITFDLIQTFRFKMIVHTHSHASNAKFIFQGFYSGVSVYPQFSDVKLCFYEYMRDESLGYRFNGVFQVMDQDLIHIVPCSHLPKLQVAGIYQVEPNFSLLFFHLQVEKIYQIHIEASGFSPDWFILYDGPGIDAEFQKFEKSATSSTFQCILHLLTKHKYVCEKLKFSFHSVSAQISTATKLSAKTRFVFGLPDEHCTKAICILLFITIQTQQINITINTMSTFLRDSLSDESCVTRGLTAVEILQHQKTERQILCKNHHTKNHSRRSFFSQNFSLFLVMYWYERYSIINVSLEVSQTECQHVFVDICQYDFHCNIYNQLCEDFVTNMMQSAFFNFSSSFLAHQRFINVGKQCTVFTVASVLKSIHEHDNTYLCWMNVQFVNTEINTISSAIEGHDSLSLKGTDAHKLTIDNSLSSCVLASLRGEPQVGIWHHDTKQLFTLRTTFNVEYFQAIFSPGTSQIEFVAHPWNVTCEGSWSHHINLDNIGEITKPYLDSMFEHEGGIYLFHVDPTVWHNLSLVNSTLAVCVTFHICGEYSGTAKGLFV